MTEAIGAFDFEDPKLTEQAQVILTHLVPLVQNLLSSGGVDNSLNQQLRALFRTIQDSFDKTYFHK